MPVTLHTNAQGSDFREMIGYASKTPSGHNTQPWKFRLSGNTVAILPDFACTLPVADGNRRELFVSLGCAVENLCIAATRSGYGATIVSRDGQGVAVALEKSDGMEESPLFSQIEKRQTNRSVYQSRKIPKEALEGIQNIVPEQGIRLYFAETGSALAGSLTEFIMRGNEAQMRDKAFKNELLSWMRFNRKEVDETKNGLTYEVMGLPAMPRFTAKPIAGAFLTPGRQNRADLKKINSSSHLVLFTATRNNPASWIDLGRTLQRFLLETTRLGIANAYMNQPCEAAPLAEEMRQLLPVDNEFPALILRIGYAEPAPRSPRKKIEVVVE